LKRSQARPQKSLAGNGFVSVMKALFPVFGATTCSERVPLCAWSVPMLAVNPPLIESDRVELNAPVAKSSQI